MSDKKDIQFRKRVFDIHGKDYEVIGKYTKAREKLLVKHNICDNEFKVTPDSFVNKGTGCPKCYGTRKRTDAEFKNEIFNLVGSEYNFLGVYINAHHH